MNNLIHKTLFLLTCLCSFCGKAQSLSNPAPFEYGKWFKEIMTHGYLAYQPKILNFNSSRPSYLHGTLMYVPRDKNKDNCMGNVIEKCELQLVTNAHGLTGSFKSPEVIIGDVDEFLNFYMQHKYKNLSVAERKEKRDLIKQEIQRELESLKHPNVYYENGLLKAKVDPKKIYRDNLNDVGIIKLGHISNAIPGHHIEHPRYSKMGDFTSIDFFGGTLPSTYSCLAGEVCEYEPWGGRVFRLPVVPMSLGSRQGQKSIVAAGASFLLSF